MRSFIVLTSLLISFSSFAQDNDKKPEAKLKLSDNNCVSPCEIILDGSKSEASKGKTIIKYIFELGNGDIIESDTPKIEFTYINFVEGNDPKMKDRYKKWRKYIDWCHKKFKKAEKFETTLKVVQSDNQSSKENKQQLLVKGSDVLPTVDGDDIVPPKPNQVLNDSTLLGIDVDGDKVRDDVENWINTEIKRVNERRALKQFARRSQEAIVFGNNRAAAREAIKKSLDASGCLSFIFNNNLSVSNQIRKLLEVEFYNTRDRLIAEADVNSHWGGADITTYDPLAVENKLKCEFTIE